MDSGNRLVAGRYRLEERIGSGAMGVVWRAHDERLDRLVAVKQLLLAPGLSEQEAEQNRARAMREGRIAARLQHPQAIGVFDVARDAGDPWLVMEYLPSTSLASVLAEHGPLPPRRVARIGRQVADALAAAHAAGIVHRDVKPGNVLLGFDGTVKLTDFGISRASGDATVTGTGELAGTPAYFAPEVARGEPSDAASDVFSLGSTLYAAVEGEPPFGLDDNTLALLRTIADGQVSPPQQAGPLTALLMRLLAQQPEHRPTMSAARDLLGAIADGGDELPAAAPAPAPPPDRAAHSATATVPTSSAAAPRPSAGGDHRAGAASPWWRRPRALLPAATVLLLLLAAIGVAAFGNGGDGQQAAAGPQRGASATTSTASRPPPPPPGPEQLTRTVREYYDLLPDDTGIAWEYLGPGARQQAGGRSGYERFWSGIERVRIDGPVRVDGAVVLLRLRFDPHRGGASHERYRLTLAPGPDGRTLIQTSERIGFYDPREGADRADSRDSGSGSSGGGTNGGGGSNGGGSNGGGSSSSDDDDGNPGRGGDDNPGRGGGDDNPGRGSGDDNPGRGSGDDNPGRGDDG